MRKLRGIAIISALLLITLTMTGCAGKGSDAGSTGTLQGEKTESSEAISSDTPGTATSADEDEIEALKKKIENQSAETKGFSKTYDGTIDIKKNAESGTISFSVSDAEDKISNIGITFKNIAYSAVSGDKLSELNMESESTSINGVFDVKDGRFEVKQGENIVISGSLNGSKAEGTIHYIVSVASGLSSDKMSCDLGTWNWTAELKK